MDEVLNTTSGLSTFHAKALRAIYFTIGIVGLSGNLVTVIVLLSNKASREKVTNIYIINQGILDGLASIIIAAFGLTASDGAHLSGYGDDLLCRLWLTRFPIWSILMNSTYNLLALTLDRYFKIVHPIQYKKCFSAKIVIGMILFTWMVGPIFNISWKWPTSGIVNGTCRPFQIWPNKATAVSIGILTVTLEFFLPIAVLLFAYISIILVLRRRTKSTHVLNAGFPNSRNLDIFTRAKHNTIKTLVIVALCFVLCWVWNQVFIFLFLVGCPVDFGGTFYHIIVVLVFCNCWINPVIYCVKYDDFRSSLRKLFCKT